MGTVVVGAWVVLGTVVVVGAVVVVVGAVVVGTWVVVGAWVVVGDPVDVATIGPSVVGVGCGVPLPRSGMTGGCWMAAVTGCCALAGALIDCR